MRSTRCVGPIWGAHFKGRSDIIQNASFSPHGCLSSERSMSDHWGETDSGPMRSDFRVLPSADLRTQTVNVCLAERSGFRVFAVLWSVDDPQMTCGPHWRDRPRPGAVDPRATRRLAPLFRRRFRDRSVWGRIGAKRRDYRGGDNLGESLSSNC
jgi:hypothetical protein